MQQDPDQKEDDKASTGGLSSLNFNFLSDFESGEDALETPVSLYGNEPEFAGERLSVVLPALKKKQFSPFVIDLSSSVK